MNNKRKSKQSGIKLDKKGLLGTAESNAVFRENAIDDDRCRMSNKERLRILWIA